MAALSSALKFSFHSAVNEESKAECMPLLITCCTSSHENPTSVTNLATSAIGVACRSSDPARSILSQLIDTYFFCCCGGE